MFKEKVSANSLRMIGFMQSTCHLSDNVNDEYMAYLRMFVDIYIKLT